jgi:hypothetical protein
MTEPEPERFHRDRREHGGSPEHIDDDKLARLTEEERVEAGVGDFDPDEVPAATDAPPAFDLAESEEFQEARAEIRHEYDQDELLVEGERPQFPPTRYDRE